MSVANPEQTRREESADFSTHLAECYLKATELEEIGQDAFDEAAPFFEREADHVKLGNFHNMRAMAFRNLAASENRNDYFDRALVEYAGARFHFEAAGHSRSIAGVDNNVGNLLYHLGRYGEALEHLDRARELLSELKDTGTVAQINEARAKVFIALERYPEAEIAASGAVHILERGAEASPLAEALTTHGVALARMGREAQARAVLERAAETAQRGGDCLRAGQAHLSLIEELGEQMLSGELARHYEAADNLIGENSEPATLERLRACARRFVAPSSPVRGDNRAIDAFLNGGTLEQEVLHLEEVLIRRALDEAGGHITQAARLLGTSHQALDYMLRARHPNLLAARTPISPRRRSIIKKHDKKPARSRR